MTLRSFEVSGVLQESYSLLARLGMALAREESESVDTLSYSWQNLQQQARETATRLTELEPHFRRQLTDDVAAFVVECDQFCSDYQTVGVCQQIVSCYYLQVTATRLVI